MGMKSILKVSYIGCESCQSWLVNPTTCECSHEHFCGVSRQEKRANGVSDDIRVGHQVNGGRELDLTGMHDSWPLLGRRGRGGTGGPDGQSGLDAPRPGPTTASQAQQQYLAVFATRYQHPGLCGVIETTSATSINQVINLSVCQTVDN